jgi:glycosyltransferase involved in cell wall biosynthesis
MARIAVNTRLLLADKLEGIGRFSFETLRRITVSHPEHSFFFLFDRPFSADFIFSDNITPLIIGPKARHPLLFVWWFEYALPPVLRSLKPDLFLSPDGFLSLKAKVRSLPVIHDINFHHHPRDLSYTVSRYYNYYFPRFAAKADRIATVSEFSKKDISATYHYPSDLIDVVYNGVSDGFKQASESEVFQTRKKYSNGKPFFLYLGSLQPRKNLVMLMKAYGIFRSRVESEVKLILAGSAYMWTSEMEKVLNAHPQKDDIVLTGRVEEKELHALLAAALALTYIPKYEGFGIPLIEAMASGTPIIASSVSSIPEVCDDAAILCNPNSAEEVAEAMMKISGDNMLRQHLVDKGLSRQQKFSWDNTASGLWRCIEKTMIPC